ncbi:MAG: DNA-binding protein YbiB [Burkholderiaceae bacterium]|nr:DNA-binding protein YbiB [Burkholderiaceae bacterium]
MQFPALIKEVGRGARGARDLDPERAQVLFGAMLDGAVPEMELGALLLAYRIKGESPDEMAAFMAAMQARTAVVAVPDGGPRCVLLPTYNGARKQPNLMPLVALLLARDGVPVLIHGRHDFDSRTSPFELLAALDLHAAADTEAAAADLVARRLAVLPLAVLNPGLDALLALRPRLGVRNSGHALAKLLDPCPGRSVRVVAVTHPPYLDSMQALLEQAGATALLMRGTEGEAYAAPRRRPRLLGFRDGVAEVMFDQAPGDEADSGAGCAVDENAALIRAMLEGRVPVPQPLLDQVAALRSLAQV